MSRSVAAFAAAGFAALLSVLPVAADAQRWNDERTLALIARATELRARQLADTALTDYRATAHGYLTFLAQLGEGFTEPPKIVKADELALEVYWRAPNMSKQRIIGRRDTLLLPTDINYHRDHLGIVQNNFPDIIRLGDGDEVADVPHPLSSAGIAAYDFAVRDSLAMELPDRTIRVTEVLVRPRDDREPRLIGAIYIDQGSGEVVRMAFNFTRSAFLDRQLEDLFITLENALVGGRFWLPRRQEIEIRRSGTWLDYPVRGIIRGRWDICCYELNVGLEPRFFLGPEIVVAPLAERIRHEWQDSTILGGLPDEVRVVADADVRRVQEEARALVRQQALSRARGAALSARRLSDLVRVNRVEGLALGAGTVLRLGAGVRAEISARWGFADDAAKGRVALAWERANGRGIGLFAERAYRDAGQVAEVSLLRNSIAAQEAGSDYTNPFGVRAAGAWVALGELRGASIRIEGAVERHDRLTINAELRRVRARRARLVARCAACGGRRRPPAPCRAARRRVAWRGARRRDVVRRPRHGARGRQPITVSCARGTGGGVATWHRGARDSNDRRRGGRRRPHSQTDVTLPGRSYLRAGLRFPLTRRIARFRAADRVATAGPGARTPARTVREHTRDGHARAVRERRVGRWSAGRRTIWLVSERRARNHGVLRSRPRRCRARHT